MNLILSKRQYFLSGTLSIQAIAFIALGIIAFVCVVLYGFIVLARIANRNLLLPSNIFNSHTRTASLPLASRPPQINRTPKPTTHAVLTESQFDMLPSKVLRKPDTKDDQVLDSCSICLSDIAFGDIMVTLLPCNHFYHIDCIRQWLTKKSIYCPLCKANIQVGLGIDNVSPQRVEEGNVNRRPVIITRPERAHVERFMRAGWHV